MSTLGKSCANLAKTQKDMATTIRKNKKKKEMTLLADEGRGLPHLSSYIWQHVLKL